MSKLQYVIEIRAHNGFRFEKADVFPQKNEAIDAYLRLVLDLKSGKRKYGGKIPNPSYLEVRIVSALKNITHSVLDYVKINLNKT